MKCHQTVLVAIGALSQTSTALASITGVTGWVQHIAPPSFGAAGDNYAWNERTNVTLNNVTANTFYDWTIDHNGSGPFTYPIPATFDSHMLNLYSQTGVLASGTITFSQRIFAVIYDISLLDLTDASCGALGTTYPTGLPRGFLSPFVNGYLNVTGNVLTFDINPVAPHQGNGYYQFRVLTETPAPGTLTLSTLALVMATRRRRT